MEAVTNIMYIPVKSTFFVNDFKYKFMFYLVASAKYFLLILHTNMRAIYPLPFLFYQNFKNNPNRESDYTNCLPVKINRQPDVNYLVENVIFCLENLMLVI